MIESSLDSVLEQQAAKKPAWRRSRALVFLFCGLILYSAHVYIAVRRPLWFDELLTYDIAKAPTATGVLHSVRTWDLNPPTLHLLAHYSMRIFGRNAIALRLPSIVEFYLASLTLFVYTFRKSGSSFAAFAVILFWSSAIFQYATDARPYALLCLCFSCLLVSWHCAVTTQHRRVLALSGVAVSNAGMFASHVFAPFSLLPFVAAEFVRWINTRQRDYALWAALLVPSLGVLGYLPLYDNYKAITLYPRAFQASVGRIAAFYWDEGHSLVTFACLASLVAWLVCNRQVRWPKPTSLFQPTFIFFLVLTVNPILLNLLLMFDHSAFWPRYCVTTVIGFCVVIALALSSAFRGNPQAGYSALLCVGAVLVVQRIVTPVYHDVANPPVENAKALLVLKPTLPLVVASGLTFEEMVHREQPPLPSRLYYLKDRKAATQYAHATIYEDLDRFQKYFGLPGNVQEYQDFMQQHDRFLILGTFEYPEDWLLKKLRAERATITLLGEYRIPYKDHNIYEVTLRKLLDR